MSYFLGGGVSGRRNRGVGPIRVYEMVIGGVSVMGFLIVNSSSIWASIGIIAVGAGIIGFFRVRSFLRGLSVGRTPQHWRILEWAGLDRHERGDKPGLFRQCDIAEHRTEGGVDIALMTHISRSGATVTGVLEQRGRTVGFVPQSTEEAAATMLNSWLVRMAAPTSGVTRVDFITQIYPAVQTREPYGPVEAELASIASMMGVDHRHFMAVTMNPGTATVDEFDGGTGDQDLFAAVCVLDDVARVSSSHGLTVTGVVSTDKIGTFLQSFYVPSVYPVDPDAGEGWAGIPSYESTEIGVESQVGDTTWLCSVAVIQADGWPPNPVEVNWLDPLTSGIPGVPFMTVIVSHVFVAHRTAVNHATGQSALAQSKVYGAQMKGVVLDGIEQQRADAANWALNDLKKSSAGDTPVLRVLVYAATETELLECRRKVEDVLLTNMNIEDVSWCDNDHARQLAACTPFGMGIGRLT